MSELIFKEPDEPNQTQALASSDKIKVIIADDEEEVHVVTKYVLRDFEYKGQQLEFLSAYSGDEAKRLLRKHPDASLILLDIVMEKDDSGLNVAEFIREDLCNNLIRIILRTGQPGLAPEEDIIAKYDINDYKEKTELTSRKFKTAMTMALRAYADIITIDSFRAILEEEVRARTAELEEKNRELERLNRELERYATIDSLTGVFNRMKFNAVLETEILRSKRYQRPMSMAMLDIDFFKSINDNFGHAAGDCALREFVTVVSQHIRECDVLARWGGEEFVILFPETTLEESLQVSEKLRQKIEENSFDRIGNLTCSFGVTQFTIEDGIETLSKRVDDALYEAKKNGRNTIACKLR